MAEALGLSRTAVWKHIQALKRRGYQIEGKSRRGYRWAGEPDVLWPDEIRKGLHTHIIGRVIHHHETAESTQDLAKRLAAQGEVDGTVVIAEEQTSGRGRLGRTWHSAKGGLWCTFLLKPSFKPGQVPALALAASLAVTRAVHQVTKLHLSVKWPNDVVFRHGHKSWRKVAGILTEMSAETDRVHYVALGLGLNINNPLPASLKKTGATLASLLGRPVSRLHLVRALFHEMDASYRLYQRHGFHGLAREYKRKGMLWGRNVRVVTLEGTIRGRAIGCDPEGRLLVRSKGKTQAFLAGDVTLA